MSSRFSGLDWLRGLAALGIVGCHLNLRPAVDGVAVLLHFTDMNVGVFGIVSGFLFQMSRSRTSDETALFEFLKKRAFRLLPIYVVWSVVYLSLSFISNFGMDGDTEKFKNVWFWLSVVFKGGASCHLWFLSSLLYVSIVMGVVAWYCHGWLLRIILLPASILSIFLSAYVPGNFFFYTIRLLAFFNLGMWMWACGFQNLQVRLPWLVGLLIVAGGLSFLPIWHHHFLPDYICAFVLVLVFLRLRDVRPAGWFGETSFAVYLVHPALTAICGIVMRKVFSVPYGVGVVALDWVVCYGLALAISCLAIRLPYVARFMR